MMKIFAVFFAIMLPGVIYGLWLCWHIGRPEKEENKEQEEKESKPAEPDIGHLLMGDEQYKIDHDRVNEGLPIERLQSHRELSAQAKHGADAEDAK